MDKEILFTEQQRFKQWWVWLIILAVNGLLVYGFVVQCIQGKPFGNHPMSDHGLVIALLLSLLLTFLFVLLKLETKIGKDGVYVRFFPFRVSYKYFPWEEIVKVYVRTYDPLSEYGGWGVRGFRNNKALNVSGNQGLQLVLNDDRKLLIGTRKPDEITGVLRAIGK